MKTLRLYLVTVNGELTDHEDIHTSWTSARQGQRYLRRLYNSPKSRREIAQDMGKPHGTLAPKSTIAIVKLVPAVKRKG